jgi:hypothetical protein
VLEQMIRYDDGSSMRKIMQGWKYLPSCFSGDACGIYYQPRHIQADFLVRKISSKIFNFCFDPVFDYCC